MITLDNAVFRLWFCAGSVGPILSLIHVNEAEVELLKRLKDPDTKLVARNRPLRVPPLPPTAPTSKSGSIETKQATAATEKIEASMPSPALIPPPAGKTNIRGSAETRKGSGTGAQQPAATNENPRVEAVTSNVLSPTQASSGKNGKKGKKGKSTATGQAATKQNPIQIPALAPLVDKPPTQPEPAPVPPKGPGCQIAVEVFEGADTIILRYIPFEYDMRAVATNDLDELTAYSMDKDRGKIRVGPIVGLEFEKLEPMPGHDIVDCIYEQFYIRGEDPWAFHLRDGDGGGRKGIHILDFIDEYIRTSLKKEAEEYELKTLMKNLK